MQHVAPTLFRPADKQAISLLDITAPARLVEASLAEKVRAAVAVVKSLLQAGKHLVAASSFGKDSSVMVALALRAMEELQAEGFAVPELHVMNSDTLMENPVVHAYAQGEIKALRAYAKAKALPVRVWICRPNLTENWLVSMIGGRTVASLPGNSAKCQQQLKKAPLERTKRQIRAKIKAELGKAFRDEDLVLLIGTRRDESAARERNMEARGERADVPVNTAKPGETPTWVLSPIADFTTEDIFCFLAEVTNERFQTYSDFKRLTDVYRDAAGECMINVFIRDGGAERKTSCGSRHGCWGCLRVSTDRSMENMLAEESGKHRWMKPLNDFRNYLKARHYDPAARNWASRTVDPDTGYLTIAANAYSPDFCLELLRYALTIDADEADWAMANRKPRRFTLLGMKEILTIDLYWGRYAYQRPFTALNEYREICERGRRYTIPEAYEEHPRSALKVGQAIQVPFADRHFTGFHDGLRSVSAAAAGAEHVINKGGVYYTHVNETQEFDIDDEGVELFYEFELDRALEYYGPHTDVYPSEVVHYLARFGVVSFKKGGHSSWDRMLRIGNQLHRAGVRDVLNDPEALAARLRAYAASAERLAAAARPQAAERPAPAVTDSGQYLMAF
ncbi:MULTISPECIES: phosphoadenosine phosphosulfate reductase domain-containing protein [unclassified Pseudomonas]|uniref:phosphoadenosine phosphosulfate reductase domain-containing protein n=1 Tax=unclassified Pseudomonas TaxID=196821 RepID=UPI0015656ACF|nr:MULTISPECIES: phosphoadenosine phosphosulfate reductase family protein [unclassified Pseudomonas]NRH44461.1 hypothetical protein [Pseudomonas sp. MS15a(2019)]